MPIDPDAVVNYAFPDIRHDYLERDAILYALGIGLGADPLDQQQLDFLLESRLRVLPTFAATLASPGMWIRDPALGIDFTNVVHAAQHASFAKPLPPHGSVVGRARIASLADRGAGRGARLLVERSISDAEDGSLYCTLCQELLLRGDGGFGGESAPKPADRQRPDRSADFQARFHVSPRAALIYRLSGDWNPLHADPATAQRAGFARPILHGYATYGLSGWALIQLCGGGDPAVLASLSVRFTGAVTPGESIDFLVWQEQSHAFFEARVAERAVLQHGFAALNIE